MLVNCSCPVLPLSKSARVLRRSSGRRREPRCSVLKGGFLCRLEAMIKAGYTGLQLGVNLRREWKRPRGLTYKDPRVGWEERSVEHDWTLGARRKESAGKQSRQWIRDGVPM